MPRTVKIGLVAPFSGRYAARGYDLLFAVKLALQEWNQAEGGAGYPVELVAYDDHNEGAVAVLQARKLALDQEVVGIVGHLTLESAFAAAKAYQQAGLAALALAPGVGASASSEGPSPGLSPGSLFWLAPSAACLAQTMADILRGHGFRGRIAVVAGPDDAKQEQAKVFQAAAHDVGLQVEFIPLTAYGRAGYQQVTARLVARAPDAAYFIGDPVAAAAIWGQVGKSPLRPLLYSGPQVASPDFLLLAGAAAEGAFYLSANPHPRDLPEAASFRERFRARWGKDPDAASALAYDATNLLLQSVGRAAQGGSGLNREAVREALAGGEAFLGITGPVSFDRSGHRRESAVALYRIEGLSFPGRLQQTIALKGDDGCATMVQDRR